MVGLTENEFKTRYTNHKASFNNYEKRNSTELSKYIWNLKNNNKQLLDEAEHDIKNYSDRGQCYLPKRS
jgi:hypothetical protein